jgi:polyferredoxin
MNMVTVSGLYEIFGGLDLSRTFPQIDTISGATVSSRAVIADVREAASLAAGSLFNLKVPDPVKTAGNPWFDWKTLALAFVLLVSLFFGSSWEPRAINHIVMLLNLVLIGFVLNTPLTLSALSKVLMLDLPGPGNTLLILILLYIVVSIPVQGRSYCRLVCPFGTLQHLVGRLSPWQLNFSPAVLAFLPGFRRFVLGLLLVLGVWVGWSGFTEVEPFFGLFSFRLTVFLWVMVIFVLVVSVFLRRFWCNTMCPTGTMLSMVSRALRPRIGRDDETV